MDASDIDDVVVNGAVRVPVNSNDGEADGDAVGGRVTLHDALWVVVKVGLVVRPGQYVAVPTGVPDCDLDADGASDLDCDDSCVKVM